MNPTPQKPAKKPTGQELVTAAEQHPENMSVGMMTAQDLISQAIAAKADIGIIERLMDLRDRENMSVGMMTAQDLISQAIAAKADIGILERLMDLRDRVLKEEAKKAFNKAMADFQAECPVIAKTKEVRNDNNVVVYKYAPIESAIAQVKELVQKHGFRYSTTMKFNRDDKGEKTVIAYCRVVHEMGHEEVSEMEVPMGNKTKVMSESQVVAAASTFAKRYAFLNAFGIMTGDEDNDTADQRGDAPGQAPSKKAAQTKSAAPAAAPKEKKQRPPRGVPYYDPEEDDGGSITPKQRAFMMKRWGMYMDKAGVTDEEARMRNLEKFIPWAFKPFNKTATLDGLTVAQASYLIDYIPTVPVKASAPAAPAAAPYTPPPAPPKPKTLTDADIASRIESIGAQPDMKSLDDVWNGILEEKNAGLLGGNFFKLHQAYIRTKNSLKAA